MSEESWNGASLVALKLDEGEPSSAASASSPDTVVARSLTLEKGEVFSRNMFKRQKLERSSNWRDWARLPDDILVEIGEKLLSADVVNYISLRGVCRDWRQATIDPVNIDRRFRPHNWIMMFRKCWSVWCDYFNANLALSDQLLHCFLNTSNGKCVWVEIPELRDHFVHGCVDGLLILCPRGSCDTGINTQFIDQGYTQFIDQGFGWETSTQLLNPFTGSMTEYPAMSQLYDQSRGREFWPHLISFAFYSSSILVAADIFNVAYAKPGDKEWKVIKGNCFPHAGVFFKGCLHIYATNDNLVQFELDEDRVELRSKTLILAQDCPSKDIQGAVRRYLVEFEGYLLALHWMNQGYRQRYFKVFKVVVQSDAVDHKKGRLEFIKNLGNRAIFIHSRRRSIAVSTATFPRFQRNTVYYYEDETDLQPIIYQQKKPRRRNVDSAGHFYWRGAKAEFEESALSILPFIPASHSTGHGADTGRC